ncbi:unnamed protein product [Blepharisma stoltei]|uniref:Myb-like DNA-binding domain containing protein n=1 Tax=Blepharisma stoltei TaxID=1481888 RepID=A0AAU9J848_9CILI|nr:unnamed protein product [Blepharisma stoltei]
MMNDKNIKPIPITDDVWMVPCSISKDKKEYQAIGRPYNSDIKSDRLQARQFWLPEEDETLRDLVLHKGTHRWSLIAKEVNSIVHNGMPIRQGKQCRERWYNHLNDGLIKGNWTPEEDIIILEKQLEWGNKWSDIARLLKGRTENQVKNRWKSITKRSKKSRKGREQIKTIISEKKGLEPESVPLSSVMPISPMIVSSPGFIPFAFDDHGFSNLADQIKTIYQIGMTGMQQTDVSPSAFLFLNSPNVRQ